MAFPGFPGQNKGPVAPTPAAGGFAAVAPQQASAGFAPRPGGGFSGQQAQQAPTPQATRPMMTEEEKARLRGAQIGAGKRERLPVGHYVCLGEDSELKDTNEGKNVRVQNRMLFTHFRVEESDNPTIRPGHVAKTLEFMDTEYRESVDRQLAKFKGHCASLYGATDEEMDSFDWLTPVLTDPTVFNGNRYSVSVTNVFDKQGRQKFDKQGRPVTRDTIQRIA